MGSLENFSYKNNDKQDTNKQTSTQNKIIQLNAKQ